MGKRRYQMNNIIYFSKWFVPGFLVGMSLVAMFV